MQFCILGIKILHKYDPMECYSLRINFSKYIIHEGHFSWDLYLQVVSLVFFSNKIRVPSWSWSQYTCTNNTVTHDHFYLLILICLSMLTVTSTTPLVSLPVTITMCNDALVLVPTHYICNKFVIGIPVITYKVVVFFNYLFILDWTIESKFGNARMSSR
jgi:hypothetical protein